MQTLPTITTQAAGTTPAAGAAPVLPPAQLETWSADEYGGRLLCWATTYGPEPLSLSQLELVDMAACRAVAALPAKLDADAARLAGSLHAMRRRIAALQARRRAQLAQAQRSIAALYQTGPDDEIAALGGAQPAQPAAQPAELTADERIARLLRAVIVLASQQDGGSQDGGRGARLIRPTPTQPPSGTALQQPGSPGDVAQQRRGRF